MIDADRKAGRCSFGPAFSVDLTYPVKKNFITNTLALLHVITTIITSSGITPEPVLRQDNAARN